MRDDLRIGLIPLRKLNGIVLHPIFGAKRTV